MASAEKLQESYRRSLSCPSGLGQFLLIFQIFVANDAKAGSALSYPIFHEKALLTGMWNCHNFLTELKVKNGLTWLKALPPEEISWLWIIGMQGAHKENKRHIPEVTLTLASIQNILVLTPSHWTHWLLCLLKLILVPHIVHRGIPQPFFTRKKHVSYQFEKGI